MTHALITLKPLAILKEFPRPPARLVLPNGDQVEGTTEGWTDGAHMLAEVVRVNDPPTPFHHAADGKATRRGATVTIERTFAADDLADVKTELVRRIKTDGEAARRQYITAGSGKAMVYLRKETRARECLHDLPMNRTAENYPLLAATVPRDGDDVEAVARTVISRAQAWETAAAGIEAAEAAGLDAVTAAASVTEAWAAYQAVTWPGPQ